MEQIFTEHKSIKIGSNHQFIYFRINNALSTCIRFGPEKLKGKNNLEPVYN